MNMFVRLIVGAILTTATATCCEAAGNPLIGIWKLSGPGYTDRDGNSWCTSMPRFDFTPTSETIYAAATKFRPAAQSTSAVTYLVSGNKVYVSTEPSFYNAPSYLIVGPNKMMSEDVGHCPYQKQ